MAPPSSRSRSTWRRATHADRSGDTPRLVGCVSRSSRNSRSRRASPRDHEQRVPLARHDRGAPDAGRRPARSPPPPPAAAIRHHDRLAREHGLFAAAGFESDQPPSRGSARARPGRFRRSHGAPRRRRDRRAVRDHRDRVPLGTRYVQVAADRSHDRVLFVVTSIVVGLLIPFLVSGLPVWLPACVAALVLVGAFLLRDRRILRVALVPWQLVVFASGLFLVVAAGHSIGLEALLGAATGSATRFRRCCGWPARARWGRTRSTTSRPIPRLSRSPTPDAPRGAADRRERRPADHPGVTRGTPLASPPGGPGRRPGLAPLRRPRPRRGAAHRGGGDGGAVGEQLVAVKSGSDAAGVPVT